MLENNERFNQEAGEYIPIVIAVGGALLAVAAISIGVLHADDTPVEQPPAVVTPISPR